MPPLFIMKLLIPLLFLCFSSYSQTFMSQMDIVISKGDTTIRLEDEKVVWGIKDHIMCFIWKDQQLCFKRARNSKLPKYVRKHVKDYGWKGEDYSPGNPNFLKLREIYYNQWGEIYVILVYVNKDFLIFICRLDRRYPQYFISTSPPKTQ